MTRFFALLADIWFHRKRLLLPLLVLPALFLAVSFSLPPRHVATTTLQVDGKALNSPLLSHLNEAGNHAILQDILTSPTLIMDTEHKAGTDINPRALRLDIPSAQLIRVSYASRERDGMETLLAIHARHFIQELLAPERFRLEQMLSETELLLRKLNAEEAAQQQLRPRNAEEEAAQNFALERLHAQIKLAEKRFNEQSNIMTKLGRTFDGSAPLSFVWFAEPPRLLPQPQSWRRHLDAVQKGLWLGLLFGLLWILLYQLTNKSLRTDRQLSEATKLPILGQVPSLGAVRLGKGTITVETL